MKTPTARKLPSGSWFIRVQIDGKSHSITKPTEKEALAEALALKAGFIQAKKSGKMTVSQAIDKYIEARDGIISPSTAKGYRDIQSQRFKTMMQRDIFSLSEDQWQRAVKAEKKHYSAKTIKNTWGFLSSVIYETTGRKYSVTLPQVIEKEIPFFEPEEIPVFIEAIKGRSIEIPALLGLSSLRQSEILALRWKDIHFEKGVLKVDGATVRNENGKLIRKPETKNTTSRRTVPILPPLRRALEQARPDPDDKSAGDSLVVTMAPNSIRNHINKICERNELPRVGLHGLRHSFASLGCHLGIPEDVIMEIGGWSDYQTMKKIYTHVARQDIQKRSKELTSFFDKM